MSTSALNVSSPISGFSSPHFKLSPPALTHTLSDSASKVYIQANPKTDFWRTPPYSKESDAPADRRTGAFFAIPIAAEGDFEASVWIRGKWGVQYDQGCLMVIAGDDDGEGSSWIKTGVEMDGGKEWVGGVVSSPYSDWSVSIAPHSTSTLLSSSAYALYLRITRTGPTVRVHHLFAPNPSTEVDEGQLTMLREVKAFDIDPRTGLALSAPGSSWRVGVMVCGPKNDAGTEAVFEGFKFKML